MSTKVFVYGTLLEGFGNHRLLASSELLGRAKIRGFRMFDLGSFPGIVPASRITADVSFVYGEVYRVSDAVLERLDALEGHPSFYCRQEVTATIEGRQETVFVYVLARTSGGARYGSRLIADGDYREYVTAKA